MLENEKTSTLPESVEPLQWEKPALSRIGAGDAEGAVGIAAVDNVFFS